MSLIQGHHTGFHLPYSYQIQTSSQVFAVDDEECSNNDDSDYDDMPELEGSSSSYMEGSFTDYLVDVLASQRENRAEDDDMP
jgi:hypothetical protein